MASWSSATLQKVINLWNEITILMYYSGITLFEERHDFVKISSCFVFSCIEMPRVISDIRLTGLVNINFVSIVL